MRVKIVRLNRSLAAALVGALVVLGTLASLALGAGAAQPSAPSAAWQQVLGGLYGDRVYDVALIGSSDETGRPLLLASAGVGLHRSPDGVSWSAVQADPDRTAAEVLAVAADPSDPEGRTMYATLLADIEGAPLIARSENRGFDWQPRPGPTDVLRLDWLAVDQAGRVHAARDRAEQLWTSDDRGATWVTRGTPGAIDGLSFFPPTPTLQVVAGGTLYHAPPAGGAWTPTFGAAISPTVSVAHVAVGKLGRLYVSGQLDGAWHVWLSPDGGGRWLDVGWPAAAADVAPAALGAGALGLQAGAWLGLDDGRVFELAGDGGGWSLVVELPVPLTRVVVDSVDGVVWAGTDGLGLYQLRPILRQTGATSVNVRAVTVAGAPEDGPDELTVWLLAELRPARRVGPGEFEPATYAVYESRTGRRWERVVVRTALGPGLEGAPGPLLYSGQRFSIDGGRTWELIGPGPAGSAPTVVAVGPLTGTLPVVYALQVPYNEANQTGGSGLLRSENGGGTFTTTDVVDGLIDVAVSPAYVDEPVAFAAADTGVIYRADDGLQFSQVGRLQVLGLERVLYDLALSPGFPSDPWLLAAAEDPSTAQRGSVFRSESGGEGRWPGFNQGLPEGVRPRVLVLSPRFASDRVMFMGARVRAFDSPKPVLYASISGGGSWFPELELPPETEVLDFAWRGDGAGSRVLAALGPHGLWVRDLDSPPAPPSATTPPTATASPPTTPTSTASPTAVLTATVTPTGTVATPTATSAVTATTTLTPTATAMPSATASPTPTSTDTHTPTPTSSPTDTETPVPTPTATPAPRPIYLPALEVGRGG